ncbi:MULTISPECIES: phosphate/phosphite/phosphonate ABC transporter substrate-binding protein [Mesorhizobium]|uniref:phosphate/phosphite/phosphonate ABC transporter substrate-binding protein n=1 Tax=Mesorhizobium TaxID=68287 RepID=UPI0003CF4E5D|nr:MULTISPECIES: phosphate/phosphite/phosphonate ABC transporter substrate-binding protein [Mesorhizobium]ESY65713.1 phosphonate ABC transporter substrate-binding protein [Mesorhizobium sp. LNHC232B00]WJI38128.1 phosphate/phosphite/phosphonate ABC transporter substrate-binding protein [Mesorhizobium opportunistum]
MKATPKALAALMLVRGAFWCGPAQADWRDDIGTFRIGVVAEPGAGNTVPGLAQLTQAFTNALGMKVEFVVARDYAALIEAQANARIEYAIYSATAYATALQRCGCVEPLVAPVDSDGAAGIRSVLLTRDGKLSGLAAMGTHRIAMPPSDSVGGSLLPLAGLAAEHVKIAEDSPFLIHAVTASAAEAMLFDGSADALFGWVRAAADGQPLLSGGTQARLEAAGLSPSAFQIVWTSGVLRYGPHAVRSDLDPEAKRRLTVFLTNLKSTTPDVYDLLESKHSGGFLTVAPKDYAMAEAIVRFVSTDGGQQ